MLAQRYRNMMEKVDLTEGETAALLGRVLTARERRRPARRLMPCLAAACVCMAVGVTAFAAGLLTGGFRSVRLLANDKEQNGYGLYGGEYEFLPETSLSDAVLALAADHTPGDATKYFQDQSWAAAEAFSGVSLPKNPVLDGLDIGECSLTVSSDSEGPTRLQFRQWARGMGVRMSVEVYTERMASDELWTERYFRPGDTLTQEEYTAQNGLSTVIMHLQPQEDLQTAERYEADFLLEGFQYHIEVEAQNDPEAALEQLHDILEGFEG